jgi:hypothetical protein
LIQAIESTNPTGLVHCAITVFPNVNDLQEVKSRPPTGLVQCATAHPYKQTSLDKQWYAQLCRGTCAGSWKEGMEGRRAQQDVIWPSLLHRRQTQQISGVRGRTPLSWPSVPSPRAAKHDDKVRNTRATVLVVISRVRCNNAQHIPSANAKVRCQPHDAALNARNQQEMRPRSIGLGNG